MRYKADEKLQKEVNKKRKEYLDTAINKMENSFNECIDCTLEIVRNPNEKSQIKLNAIQLLMNQYRSWKEDVDIMNRIQALEERYLK